MPTTGITRGQCLQRNPWTCQVPTRKSPAHQDDEPHELGVRAFAALAGDDVPLLGGANDDLSGTDLLLAQLMVTRQLGNSDAVGSQALGGGKACQASAGGGLGITVFICKSKRRYWKQARTHEGIPCE